MNKDVSTFFYIPQTHTVIELSGSTTANDREFYKMKIQNIRNTYLLNILLDIFRYFLRVQDSPLV